MADRPSLSESIRGISVKGHIDDGAPLLINCHDSRISIQLGDDAAVDYWAMQTGTEQGAPVYRLLPMDRG